MDTLRPPKPQLSTNVGNILFTIFYLMLIAALAYAVIMLYKYYNLVCTASEGRLNTYFGYLLSFGQTPCVEPEYIQQEIVREERDEREVFHIADQVYTYEEAECKCASYDAELATHEQIIDAYNNGADWCTYGWTKGGEAFYPTQKDTFLKTKDGECGVIGVNGGKFPRTQKFGANCYGIRPPGEVVPPVSAELSELEKCRLKESYDVSHILASDDIAPFTKTEWSVYDN